MQQDTAPIVPQTHVQLNGWKKKIFVSLIVLDALFVVFTLIYMFSPSLIVDVMLSVPMQSLPFIVLLFVALPALGHKLSIFVLPFYIIKYRSSKGVLATASVMFVIVIGLMFVARTDTLQTELNKRLDQPVQTIQK